MFCIILIIYLCGHSHFFNCLAFLLDNVGFKAHVKSIRNVLVKTARTELFIFKFKFVEKLKNFPEFLIYIVPFLTIIKIINKNLYITVGRAAAPVKTKIFNQSRSKRLFMADNIISILKFQ